MCAEVSSLMGAAEAALLMAVVDGNGDGCATLEDINRACLPSGRVGAAFGAGAGAGVVLCGEEGAVNALNAASRLLESHRRGFWVAARAAAPKG